MCCDSKGSRKVMLADGNVKHNGILKCCQWDRNTQGRRPVKRRAFGKSGLAQLSVRGRAETPQGPARLKGRVAMSPAEGGVCGLRQGFWLLRRLFRQCPAMRSWSGAPGRRPKQQRNSGYPDGTIGEISVYFNAIALTDTLRGL